MITALGSRYGISGALGRSVKRAAAGGIGTTNLISWWTLNETSGDRADSHGSNDLSDGNTVGYGTGIKGNAADFESNNQQHLSISDNASLSFGDEDFSVGCWCKAESFHASAVQHLISKYAIDSRREYSLWFYPGTNKPEFSVSYNGTNYTKCAWGSGLSTATWYFIVGWHDSANDKLFIQVNNGTPVSVDYSSGCNDNSAIFRLGAATSSGTNPFYYFDGLIDEAFVWNRVLTNDERTWLYNSGAGRTYTDL